MLKLERKLVILDVETHAMVAAEEARIVEIGLIVVYPDDRPILRYSTLVNPEILITEEAEAKHHISNAMVQGCRHCGQLKDDHIQFHTSSKNTDLDIVISECEFQPWPKFGNIARSMATGLTDCDFCGYFVQYDLRVFDGEFTRAGVPWTLGNAKRLDASAIWRYKQPRKLEDAVREFLGREPTESHRALGDAQDAFDVVKAQLARWTDLPHSIQEIHDLCFDPNHYDLDGRFTWKDDILTCCFGKHEGTPLDQMPKGYLKWMLKDDFSSEIKSMIEDYLIGIMPVRK